jgi:hypothetical protein
MNAHTELKLKEMANSILLLNSNQAANQSQDLPIPETQAQNAKSQLQSNTPLLILFSKTISRTANSLVKLEFTVKNKKLALEKLQQQKSTKMWSLKYINATKRCKGYEDLLASAMLDTDINEAHQQLVLANENVKKSSDPLVEIKSVLVKMDYSDSEAQLIVSQNEQSILKEFTMIYSKFKIDYIFNHEKTQAIKEKKALSKVASDLKKTKIADKEEALAIKTTDSNGKGKTKQSLWQSPKKLEIKASKQTFINQGASSSKSPLKKKLKKDFQNRAVVKK